MVDLVFILLISNAVQNAMTGPDFSLIGGLVAASSLFIVNYIFKMLIYRFPLFGKILQGEPLMLIYSGKIDHNNLERSQISDSELMEAIREHGLSTIADVDLAVLETDGNISVLSDQFHKRTTKRRKTHRIVSKGQA